MTRRKDKTLSRSLIAGLALTVSISTVMITLIHLGFQTVSARRQFEVKASDYISFLQDSLSRPLWNFDHATIEKIAESILKSEMIAGIRISDIHKTVMFDRRPASLPAGGSPFRSGPIVWEGREVGTVDLWLTHAPWRSALLNLLWGGMAILAVSLAAIVIGARVFVARYFQRPMTELMSRMDRIAKGDYSVSETSFRHRETREIMETVSDMADRIDQRERSLANLNAVLQSEIRERERVARSLQESEQRWHDIIHFAPVGIFQATVRGRLLLVNPKLAEIFGFSSHEAFTGSVDDFFDLVSGHDERDRLMRLSLSDGPISGAEVTFYHRNGKEIWCNLSVRAAFRDGQTVFEGFIFDVTDQKAAEAATRHSERRLSQIINFLPDPTFVVDADSRVIAWNLAIERLTGVPADEMLGKGDLEYAVPFYGERRPVLIDLVRTWNEETARRYEYVRKTGDLLVSEIQNPPFQPDDAWFWNAACPLYDEGGAIAGAIETIRDITEAKRNERFLRESEFRFRSFFDSSPDGVAIIGFDGRVVDVSKSLMSRTSYKRDDLVGRHFSELTPEEHHSAIETALDSFRRGVAPESTLEIEIFTQDGRRVPVMLRAWLVTDWESRPVAIGTFIKDVSREKHLASEKAVLEKQLQQTQRLEAIGTLAGGIAHDFNNILAGILGYAELIQIKYADHTTDFGDYLDRIVEAGNRARDIVRQILQFSRDEGASHGPVEIRPIVKEAVKLVRATLPSTITVMESIDVEGATVLADPTRIHQVIMNLCTNAYHAMRESGGRLTVALDRVDLTEPRQANGSRILPGPYLQLTIRDTGHGIPPDVMDRIFDPYFTTKPVNEGTGLGLSVTLGIVKTMKGVIEVESAVGAGTAFTLWLPVIEDQICPATPSFLDVPQGRREHILLVDDEAFFLDSMREHLTLLGYRVSADASAVDALARFQKSPDDFDLILTDQSMPEMTGTRLAAHVRELNPTIPIILCTGFSDQVTEQTAGRFGISRFLMKPVSRMALARAVFDLLHPAGCDPSRPDQAAAMG